MEAGASGKAQLLCALAILVALAAALVATAGGRAASPAAGAAGLDSDALARVAVLAEPRVARRVEAIRGLRFDEIPRPEVVDSDYLNDLSAREAINANAYGGLGAAEAELRMLGLLEPDEQLESILGSTGDLAAAAYDTTADRLYVVSDAVVANRALVEFVLAHELTHALEDQRFGLDDGAGLDDDGALALLALHEGSATSLMVEYARRHLSATDLIAATAGLDSGTGGVPQFYADQLLWEYTGGARFIAALRQLAGGWKLVDHALESRPPATTEQVLHADKYVRAEPALPATVETGELRALGWRRADDGVIGEFSTRQLLEVGVDNSEAQRAAAGWGGDAYELWRREPPPAECENPCRGDLVLVANWRMDTVKDSKQLHRALAVYLDQGLAGIRGVHGSWSLLDGAATLRRRDAEVTLVLAPDGRTAIAVAGDQVAP